MGASLLRTNEKVIKELNSPFFSLIRNQKGDKIKLDTIINDYSNGRLKMIDVQEYLSKKCYKNAVYERFF